MWLSWQSGCFQYQWSAVRIQTTANFYRPFIIYCQLYCIEKTKIKEKEAGNGPFFKKMGLKVFFLSQKLLTKWKDLWHHACVKIVKLKYDHCTFANQVRLLLIFEIIYNDLTTTNCTYIRYNIRTAIAPWFRQRLPYCGPGFKSQAHQLCFYQFVLLQS